MQSGGWLGVVSLDAIAEVLVPGCHSLALDSERKGVAFDTGRRAAVSSSSSSLRCSTTTRGAGETPRANRRRRCRA